MIALMAVKDREEKEALRMRLEAETAQKRKEEEERLRVRQWSEEEASGPADSGGRLSALGLGRVLYDTTFGCTSPVGYAFR